MALGSTNTQSDKKLFILKIKTKGIDPETKKEIPFMPHRFQITEKVDGQWVAQEEMIKEFTGDLTNISFEDKEYNGTPYKVIKLLFSDEETKESYLLDCRQSRDFRNIANSILNLDPQNLTNIRISFYAKASAKDGKTYSNVSVHQGKDFIKGKYSWDDMPAVKKVKFKGTEMSDTTDLDNWTIDKLTEFASQIPKSAPKRSAVNNQSSHENEIPGDLSDDDMPF